MEFDMETILMIPLMAMKINRCHPEILKDFKLSMLMVLGHLLFTIPWLIICYNIIYINLPQDDFSEACKNCIFSITYLAVTMKYVVMVHYRNMILNLLQHMRVDLEIAKNLPLDEQSIISETASKQVNVCKEWLFLAVSSCGLFHLKMILLNFYSYVIGEGKLVHMYDLVYPKIIEDCKDDNIFVFALVNIFVYMYGIYAAVVYIAFMPLGPVFMLHASAQLEIVKTRVERLYHNEVDDKDINHKLKDIIKHVQSIHEFVGRVNACMAGFYEVTLKVTYIVLPITIFELLKSFLSGIPSLEFTMFLFTSLISSSSPCYYGNLLMEKGDEVRQAIYACGWERQYERVIRNTQLMFLQRATQPVIIRTKFRTVCFDALADVFQQAYTIFNLINTVLK